MTRIGIPAQTRSVITSMAKLIYLAKAAMCVDKQEQCTCGFHSAASGRQCRKKSIASARCVTPQELRYPSPASLDYSEQRQTD